MTQKITEITRRDIWDAIFLEKILISGRLEETDFLSRVWDLESIPSTDSRFNNAIGDIWQHTINNDDWEPDWIYSDSRFNLMKGDDEILLRFLCESVHPVVRPNAIDSEKMVQLFNSFLVNDGYELVEKTRLSGKPVYVGRYIGLGISPAVNAMKQSFSGTDAGYVAQQITRMEAAINQDPELAIGTAKELIETCCKTILNENNIEFSKKDDLPKLVKATAKQLALTPSDIPEEVKASETIKRLLSNLASITNGVAELRNLYGTGHGKANFSKGLQPRHAKLAVGAASTLAVFLSETQALRNKEKQ